MATGQPLRGFVGQSMAAKKKVPAVTPIAVIDSAVTASPYIATRKCWAFVYATGAGAGGGPQGGNDASGGGGGAALFKKLRLNPGQSISWTVGAGGLGGTGIGNGFDGGDTVVTAQTLTPLVAGGGKRGLHGVTPVSGGLGGIATGGDINRSGGGGGADGSNGGAATGGGTGGVGATHEGGGGGAAGFSETGLLLKGGNGGDQNTIGSASAPGGGSGADGGDGAAGRVWIFIFSGG